MMMADDYDFSKYRAIIDLFDPSFRPYSRRRFSFNPVEEMRCVLGATRVFLSIPHNLSLFTPFTSRNSKFRLKKWVFTTVFEENPCWKFEERKRAGGIRLLSHVLACSQ